MQEDGHQWIEMGNFLPGGEKKNKKKISLER